MDARNVTVSEAAEIQRKLRGRVQLEKLYAPPNIIAGVDVSSNRFNPMLYGGIVVMTFPDLYPIEDSFVKQNATFPYVPGYLSFREMPVLLAAFEQLKTKPDVLFVDGQGIAHPRRLGIAAHLGLELDIPTIGCAKSVLYGKGEDPAPDTGSVSYLRDPRDGEIIGALVRTKAKTKPVVVSPGHKITLDEAIECTLRVRGTYRIPEPTRRAHDAVNIFRRAQGVDYTG